MGLRVVATFFLPEIQFPEEIVTSIGAEFVKTLARSEDEIIEACKDADAVTAVTSVQPYPRRVIENLPKLRHIASIGIGYENVDLKAATERGIVVTNTPFYCLEEVAEHALALMLALVRKLFKLHNAVKAGKWGTAPGVRREILPPMSRLRGMTLGIIGFGNIGKSLAAKVQSLGMRVIAHDPYVPAEIMKAHFGVEKVELEELLRQSDVISIHTALTEETRKMLRREHFQMMKRTAYLINTSRGGVLDEAALIEALQNGWIAGAGLDVLDPEPPKPDNPLLNMENVIITGHCAQYSDQSEAELWRVPLEEIALTLQGKWPRFPVNPQVKEEWLKKWGS